MNILAVILPLLMSLMVGFGAIRIMQMMHGIIHGRNDIGTDMFQHLRGMAAGQQLSGSPLAQGLASLSGKASPKQESASVPGSSVADTPSATSTTDTPTPPPPTVTDASTDSLESADRGSSDTGSSDVSANAEVDSEQVPAASGVEDWIGDPTSPTSEQESFDAALAASGAAQSLSSPTSSPPAQGASGAQGAARQGNIAGQGTANANAAKPGGNAVLRGAGRVVGMYRRAPDVLHAKFDEPLRKLKVASAYAKSSTPAYVARALVMGRVTNAPQAMHALYPQYKADHQLRRQQMRNAAHKVVDRKLGPYIPTSPSTGPQGGGYGTGAGSHQSPSATHTPQARQPSPESTPAPPSPQSTGPGGDEFGDF
ncbi:MAG: hypothetical protein ACYCTG_05485 [Ferrimicrobium sp.]